MHCLTHRIVRKLLNEYLYILIIGICLCVIHEYCLKAKRVLFPKCST